MHDLISKHLCHVDVHVNHVNENKAQDVFENEYQSVEPNKKKV